MNVYDFDGTIYEGDSTIDFWKFCFRRHPRVLYALPKTLWRGVQYKFFHGDIESFKSAFFGFLPILPDVKLEVEAFWDEQQDKIFTWYLRQKREDDVIISASPEFLLKTCCARLNVNLIATLADEKTGKLVSRNCKGEEKVRRFFERYPDTDIQRFYSDSSTDAPMASLATEAFFVCGSKILSWTRSYWHQKIE